jgi:hypothetical protein
MLSIEGSNNGGSARANPKESPDCDDPDVRLLPY